MLRTLLLLWLAAAGSAVIFQNQSPTQTRNSAGATETVFQTRAGKITVYLPSDMAAGDTISGTVVAEPAAPKDPKQQKKYSDELSGYVIELDQNRSNVGDKQLRGRLPATIATGEVPLVLKDAKGKTIGQIAIQVTTAQPAPSRNFQIPNLAQVGRPIQIIGPFDGNSANTNVTIGGSNTPVLTESPRQVVLQNPQSTPGVTPVVINENGTAANGAFRNLSIDLTAAKTELRRGEQTELKVSVQGLAGLTEPVPLRLQNHTPQVIELAGGNIQTIAISPGTSSTQTFTRTLTGVTPGQFNIVADLVYTAGPSGAQATASPTPLTAGGTTPTTTRPTPPPTPSTPTSVGTEGTPSTTASGMPAPSPSPRRDQTIPNLAVPAGPVSSAPMPTAERKENPCCKKIRDKNEAEFGRRLLWRQGNNDLEILGPFLFIRVNGVGAKWKFDRNLEEVFCYLDKYEIASEVKQVSETRLQSGQTTEKQEVISLLFTGPDPDNKSVRPNKFFQFMASKLDDRKVKEYAASVTVDEETCGWTLSLFGDNQLKEIPGPPARTPAQIFDGLKADHDAEVAGQRPYSSPTWWDIKFRELSEIVQWCGWLRSHPDAEKEDEVRKKAFGGWRLNMRQALEDLRANGKNLSDEDRKAMAAMSKLLDEDVFDCHTAEPTLRAFLGVWGRFNSGGAVF